MDDSGVEFTLWKDLRVLSANVRLCSREIEY